MLSHATPIIAIFPSLPYLNVTSASRTPSLPRPSTCSTSGKCHLYISRENVYSNALIAMAFQSDSSYRPKANMMCVPQVRIVKRLGASRQIFSLIIIFSVIFPDRNSILSLQKKAHILFILSQMNVSFTYSLHNATAFHRGDQ